MVLINYPTDHLILRELTTSIWFALCGDTFKVLLNVANIFANISSLNYPTANWIRLNTSCLHLV